MANRTYWVFKVEGEGVFPYDMLRYDNCWPRTQEAAAAMTHLTHRFSDQKDKHVVVELVSQLRAPTVGRWESFGWAVTSQRKESI